MIKPPANFVRPNSHTYDDDKVTREAGASIQGEMRVRPRLQPQVEEDEENDAPTVRSLEGLPFYDEEQEAEAGGGQSKEDEAPTTFSHLIA